jgi:hypothetical protein
MLSDLASAVTNERGRYPVANLVCDFLRTMPPGPVVLGTWLETLDDFTLEDIQVKLDMLLRNEGPDHAAEDLTIAVTLLSESHLPPGQQLATSEVYRRLVAWHEANLLDKLRRKKLVVLHEALSLQADYPCALSSHPELERQLRADHLPVETLVKFS